MYDVIVVGARVAGSSTAALLARQGLRVLCLDKATFPSDTLSSHQVQLSGAVRLKRWGVLERLVAAHTPPTRKVKFDTGPVTLEGRFPSCEGVDACYSPRRTILDKLLVDVARDAGAEVREDVVVEDLCFGDGRVHGVRARTSKGTIISETAHMVVGADGKHSLVAKAVHAAKYYEKPVLSTAYYAYWDGLRVWNDGEIYARSRRSIGVWPTNDGLVVTFMAWPISEFRAVRSNIEASVMQTLDAAGDLGERVRCARRVGRFMGSADLPNFFRKPWGPGWALVGDAGLVMDPITGQGIGHAFRDAELLAGAIGRGLAGRGRLEVELATYEQERNRQARPMFRFTTKLAALKPPTSDETIFFESLLGNQPAVDRFLGVFAGTEPVNRYFSPFNLVRLFGVGRTSRILFAALRAGPSRP